MTFPDDMGLALRTLRSAIVAGMAVTIGAVAHTWAGGLLPGASTVMALFVLLALVSAAVLGRPASYALLAALVVGGQMVVHVVLTAMSGHPGTHSATVGPSLVVAPRGVRSQLSVVDAAPQVVTGPATPHWLQHLLDDLSGASLAMSFAHAAAAAAVAAWLFIGEVALVAMLVMVGCRIDLALRVLRSRWLPDSSQVSTAESAESPGFDDLADRLRRAATRGNAAHRGPPPVWMTRILLPTI